MKIRNNLALAVAVVCTTAPRLNADTPTRPDPAVEARVAREIVDAERQLQATNKGNFSDDNFVAVAIALARLGRLERALQVVDTISIKDEISSNGAPQTRDEVRRIVARRRCALGNLAGAEQLIPLIKTPLSRADVWLALAGAHLRRGELDAARQALFKASPLVSKRGDSMAHIAYLLVRTGEMAAARRLFSRAIGQLPPPVPNPRDPSGWDARITRVNVENYLLKAGFVDEWEKLSGSRKPFLGAEMFNSLLARNRYDTVLRLARATEGIGKVSNLVVLAIKLDKLKRDHDEALKVMAEAEAAYQALPTRTTPQAVPPSAADLRGEMAVLLAFGRRELGDEPTAQKWLNEAVTGRPPQRAASLRVLLAILPLLDMRDSKIPPSPRLLEQVASEIMPQLPLLNDPKEGYHLVQWLVEAQIGAKQFNAARAILPTLEKLALASLRGAKDMEGFSPAMRVAKQWRQIGDEAHAQTLLKTIYDSPAAPKVSKRDRAYLFVWNGFLEEGRARLALLPAAPQDKQYSPSLAFYEAKYHPNVFPQWIAQIKGPHERMEALIEFTRALTEQAVDNREETEFTLVSSRDYSFN